MRFVKEAKPIASRVREEPSAAISSAETPAEWRARSMLADGMTALVGVVGSAAQSQKFLAAPRNESDDRNRQEDELNGLVIGQ
jgi:hypothetical protein